MISNKIRVGVIGLGYLGKFHFEKYKQNRSVNLTCAVDHKIKNLEFICNSKFSRLNFKNVKRRRYLYFLYADVFKNLPFCAIFTKMINANKVLIMYNFKSLISW